MIELFQQIQQYISEKPWVLIGFVGQFLFMMRFVVQWVHSERLKKSVVPVAFWFFSLGGGVILLIYAIYQKDPVFIMGQGLGLLIYLRNLSLIFGHKENKKSAKEEKITLAVMLDELETRLRKERLSLMASGTGRTEQLQKLLEK